MITSICRGRKTNRWFARAHLVAVMAILALGTGCATVTREPPNLDPHKRQIRTYVDSGDYERDIAVVAARANAWLEQRAGRRAGAERLAVVLDLDETLFLNWPYLSRQDFGYIESAWQAWVDAAEAPAIRPVLEVYQTARRLGVDVVFLTGRRDAQRSATERNLRAIGCGEYRALICKPSSHQGASAAFKTAERRRLVTEGWTLIANVGDQESDLAGGFAERTFKLPSPFYLTE